MTEIEREIAIHLDSMQPGDVFIRHLGTERVYVKRTYTFNLPKGDYAVIKVTWTNRLAPESTMVFQNGWWKTLMREQMFMPDDLLKLARSILTIREGMNDD